MADPRLEEGFSGLLDIFWKVPQDDVVVLPKPRFAWLAGPQRKLGQHKQTGPLLRYVDDS